MRYLATLAVASVFTFAIPAGVADSPWPTRPLRGRTDDAALITLSFAGRIDGSEEIVIDQHGARWKNVHWPTPKTKVSLNGVAWTARTGSHLANKGATTFLPQAVDFASARLSRVRKGRDTIALQAASDAITIRIADNPIGADDYAFEILFAPAKPSADLHIRARIDGSDSIVVSDGGAAWTHHHWGWPHGAVKINGLSWNPRALRMLANRGLARFLPAGIDWKTARVVSSSGRDLAAIERRDDSLVVRFNDTPNGSADYEIRVRFELLK